MKGFVLAAGLGTRLKPWTDFHPKALVPVDGVPMLQCVIEKMVGSGITGITVNVFHFADQVIDFINGMGRNINVSDERPLLLETGGAILKASPFLKGEEPVLIHNADILSNADISLLEREFEKSGCDALLLVSNRLSSRKLLFDADMRLKGWHSLKTDDFKPDKVAELNKASINMNFRELAFSGIYIISPRVIQDMKVSGWSGKFSIMDYFLSSLDRMDIRGFEDPNLRLIDIGKPDSLNRASSYISSNQ